MLQKKILIVGAGIAGLGLARQLQKFNIPFKLIEKRTESSTDGAGICLPANAVKALRYLGLGDAIEKSGHRVKKIIFTDAENNILSEASLLEFPLNADWFVALHRSEFHRILNHDLKANIHFDTVIDSINHISKKIRVIFNRPELNEEDFDVIVCADGVNSALQTSYFSEQPLIDLGVNIWRWTCRYPTDELQPTYMMGDRALFLAYPIGKNEVYCYAHIFDSGQDINLNHFKKFHGIAEVMMDNLPDPQFIIPGRLRSVSQPVFTHDQIAFIGDAGHACSPMLQQGAACALEDAIVLDELLASFPADKALSHFQIFRNERVNWIVTSSDGPMKTIINSHAEYLSELYQKIREQGPLNAQGWKKLLLTDPIHDIKNYIQGTSTCI